MQNNTKSNTRNQNCNSRKAHPDERGTETMCDERSLKIWTKQDHKASPDEKVNEAPF
jgi:hypothetical protein